MAEDQISMNELSGMEQLALDLERWSQMMPQDVPSTYTVGIAMKAFNQIEVLMRHLLGWYIERTSAELTAGKPISSLTLGQIVEEFRRHNSLLTRWAREQSTSSLSGRRLLAPADFETLSQIVALRKELHRDTMLEVLTQESVRLLSLIRMVLDMPVCQIARETVCQHPN